MTARAPTSVTLVLRHACEAQCEVVIDVGADVPVFEEKLTLWSLAGEYGPMLKALDASLALERLLDQFATYLTDLECDLTTSTCLLEDIRMIRMLGRLATN